MFQNKSVFPRALLTLVFCYFIYGEAGPFTALSFGLVAISLEVISWWMGQVNKVLKIMNGMKAE
ncbi:MAG: hypothetical protein AB2745_08625 [Candidatus Thiodiazotropha endolucinida]